jgi:CubicO group peptidase (beta-lactamase class C family)
MSFTAAVAEAFAPVADAIDADRLPGAILGAVDANGQRAVAVAGSAEIVPTTSAMTRETFFDLASLTKTLFTTELLIERIARGSVGLDQPLGELIPDLRLYERDAPERLGRPRRGPRLVAAHKPSPPDTTCAVSGAGIAARRLRPAARATCGTPVGADRVARSRLGPLS